MSNILPALSDGYRWKVVESSPTIAARACVVVKLQQKGWFFWWTIGQKYAFDTSYSPFEASIPEACQKIMRESGYDGRQRAKEFTT